MAESEKHRVPEESNMPTQIPHDYGMALETSADICKQRGAHGACRVVNLDGCLKIVNHMELGRLSVMKTTWKAAILSSKGSHPLCWPERLSPVTE